MSTTTSEEQEVLDLSTLFPAKKKEQTPKIGLTLVCSVELVSLIEEIAKKNNVTRSEAGLKLLIQRLEQLGLTDGDGNLLIDVPEFVQAKRNRRAA